MKEGPKPNYWRARISNDPNFTDGMKNAATNFKVEECNVEAKAKVVNVHVAGMIAGINSPNTIDYQILKKQIADYCHLTCCVSEAALWCNQRLYTKAPPLRRKELPKGNFSLMFLNCSK